MNDRKKAKQAQSASRGGKLQEKVVNADVSITLVRRRYAKGKHWGSRVERPIL